MGLSISSLFSSNETNPSLGDLPESIVASVLVHLDPPQICKLALLNKAFSQASSADFVWDSKLPINYLDIVEKVFKDEKDGGFLCKKDVYARLCAPNLLDGGSKKVWLDKATGNACMLISSNGMTITGIDDRRYWNRIPTEESRFGTIAYVQQTWWFEADGEIEFPFPVGTYSLFFRLQLGRAYKRFGRRVCNSEHVHGWDKKPVKFQLSTSDGQQATKQYNLTDHGRWIYYHAGDFVVSGTCKSMKVKFSMMQIDCTHTKGGLCVDSVAIYPTEYKGRLRRF